MKNLKLYSIALAFLGIAGATLMVGWYGSAKIAQAMVSVGGDGFLLYAASQIALVGLMGLAWLSVNPSGKGRFPVFMWGRMVRDAASSCLPFSQLGGFVLGARAVMLQGVPPQVATITTVVDLTAEFVSEILFLVVGLVIMLAYGRSIPETTPIVIGGGAALIVGLIAFRLQRHVAPIFVKLGRRILGQWLTGESEQATTEAELTALYGQSGRVALGTFLHFIGWFGKAGSGWIAFRLLGAHIDFAGAVGIEAILHALLVIVFLVPGYAGVQEAGYVGVGGIFGVTPEIALGASLLRRARDIAIGVPTLLIWQALEIRNVRAAEPAE